MSTRALEQARAMADADQLPLEVCRLVNPAAAAGTDDREDDGGPEVHDLAGLRRLCMERDPRLLVLPDTPGVRACLDLRDLLSDLPASVAITR